MKNSKIEHKKAKSRTIFIQLIKERDPQSQKRLKQLYDKILEELSWKL